MLGIAMQNMRVQLDDETYWWLFAEAARTRIKAHEYAAQRLKRLREQEQPETSDDNDKAAVA